MEPIAKKLPYGLAVIQDGKVAAVSDTNLTPAQIIKFYLEAERLGEWVRGPYHEDISCGRVLVWGDLRQE